MAFLKRRRLIDHGEALEVPVAPDAPSRVERLEMRLTAQSAQVAELVQEKRELVAALVDIDRAAAHVILTDCAIPVPPSGETRHSSAAKRAGRKAVALQEALHRLDEVRGKTWASDDAAGRILRDYDAAEKMRLRQVH